MEAFSFLRGFCGYWDFSYGCFTSIYNLMVLVLAFVLGLMFSIMRSRCNVMNRFFGEFRSKSANLGFGFCSRSNLRDVSASKILRSWWKFVKDSILLSVENSKGDEKMSVRDNVFIDCRNGNCSHTPFEARKLDDLGSGFCSGNGVGVCCSNILSYGIGFWRLMKNLIFWLVENLNGDGNIDVGRGNSCYWNEEGFVDFRNRINSGTSKARVEEEEEDVFEECEEGDFEELEQEHRNVADAFLDFINENYLNTFMMRKFMDDDDDDDWASEEEELEEYDKLDLVGLKNALKIERERRNAAYLELEKERLAAASAAIEAMTMIQRLQNEKNLIEMEARQYRYMAEHKQIYDQEVIHHLQWIISEHELERSALENQLKQCQKRLQQGGLFDEIVEEAEEHQDDKNSGCLGPGDQLK